MAFVARIDTFLNTETVNLFKLDDLRDIIIENLGNDVWKAIKFYTNEEAEKLSDGGPNMTSYIEDGTFSEQIQESGLIDEIVNMVISDLDSQGFIKKNKSIDKFSYEDSYYKELIDEKLSPGMARYFEED